MSRRQLDSVNAVNSTATPVSLRFPSASPDVPGVERVLTPPAVAFVADLVERFRAPLRGLLDARRARQARLDAGARLDFLPETAAIRAGDWRISPPPAALQDRRVEITGPVDRKMVINALNSGAQMFMADFEDSNAPTWANQIAGQVNLMDAVRRTIAYTSPQGRAYALDPSPATLLVRPRGLHLPEQHLHFTDAPVPGCLFDYGLFVFHNAAEQLRRGAGPYFYLPKLESHLEARWWNDVFTHSEAALGLAPGTIRATVLIETLPAAFEMDEILYELRDHMAGLNCGRWDYIFSSIKTRRTDPAFVLPDRSQVTMDKGFLRAYAQLLIRTCHRRGAHAIGGMAAQIPLKDPVANEAALGKVRADKLREVTDGHDGTWVAHPGLVPIAQEIFRNAGPNQLGRLRGDVDVTRDMLLEAPVGTRTEAGLRLNIRVGTEYLHAWLGGSGCVPLHGLMEDAATAEISRTQVWQWLHHGAALDDGQVVDRPLVRRLMQEEHTALRATLTDDESRRRFDEAAQIFDELATSPSLADFLTLPAYERLVSR
ncbi:MAG: malate synthase A [Acidimicrobiia bacterium]|nr:malate synthase A [Acidimicrobiia bacterium]